MYKLGKYEIHNWVSNSFKTYRRVVDTTTKFDREISIRQSVIGGGGGGAVPVYEIWFHCFGKEFDIIFPNRKFVYYASIEDAKNHIDEFLNKLNKLKVFL